MEKNNPESWPRGARVDLSAAIMLPRRYTVCRDPRGAYFLNGKRKIVGLRQRDSLAPTLQN
jgi:hypothetical protein